MTPARLQDLRSKAAAATPGPWSAFIGSSKTFAVDIGATAHGTRPSIIDWPGFAENDLPARENKANVKFIAAANPATITDLLDTIELGEEHLRQCISNIAAMRDTIERQRGVMQMALDCINASGRLGWPQFEGIEKALQAELGITK